MVPSKLEAANADAVMKLFDEIPPAGERSCSEAPYFICLCRKPRSKCLCRVFSYGFVRQKRPEDSRIIGRLFAAKA